MAFHNVTFPDGFDYGSSFGAGFKTIVQESASGHEFRIARQGQARHRFRLIRSLETQEEAQAIKDFALARRGALHSFRLKDVSDYTTKTDGTTAPSTDDQNIGTGDGVTTDFVLVKNYGVGTPSPYSRVLELPIEGSIVVQVDAVATTAWSLVDGKILRFDTAPANGLRIDMGCQFDVPVRFDGAFDEWASLDAQGYSRWQVPQLDCVEVISETEWPETWWPGGSKDHGTSAVDIFSTFRDGQLHAVTPSGAISFYLPTVTRFVPGGAQVMSLYVRAGGGGDTVQIRDASGATLGGVRTGDTMVRLALVNDGSAVTWVAYE